MTEEAERPPPENFAHAWYTPQATQEATAASVAPVSTESLRRPLGGDRVGRVAGQRVTMEEWAGTGAIPRRLVSVEEQQSQEAARELEEYLEGRRGNPEGQIESTPMVETPPARDTRFLPVESGPLPAIEESWDEDVPAQRPLIAPVVQAVQLPTRRRKSSKGKASRYNPRRHLEMDDVVSVVPDTRRSPSPMRVSERVPSPPRRSDAPPPATVEVVEPFPRVTKGIKFGGLTSIVTDPRVDPPLGSCFNCWQRGHVALRCPRPKQRNYCFNCGRVNVDMTVCPRCSGPHRRYIEEIFGSRRSTSTRTHDEGSRAPGYGDVGGSARQGPSRQDQPPAYEAPHAWPEQRCTEAVPRVYWQPGPPDLYAQRLHEMRHRDEVTTAIHVLDRLQRFPPDTQDAMLWRLYLERRH